MKCEVLFHTEYVHTDFQNIQYEINKKSIDFFSFLFFLFLLSRSKLLAELYDISLKFFFPRVIKKA